MKRMVTWMGALAAVALLVGIGPVQAGPVRGGLDPRQLVPVPDAARPLRVEVWVDGGEGRTYYPGETVTVYFRVNRDAYVVLHDIDTEGQVHRLYPRTSQDPEFVQGGIIYAVPGHDAGYRLVADGPPGEEYVQAVASDRPLVRRWNSSWAGMAGRSEMESLDGAQVRIGRVSGDRLTAMSLIAERLVEVPDRRNVQTDTDYVGFFIGTARYTPPPRGHHDRGGRDSADRSRYVKPQWIRGK